MRKKIIFCLGLLMGLSFNMHAQLLYKKGVITTKTNQTQEGFILDRGDFFNSRDCYFKPDRNSPAVKYSPEQIRAYKFHDGNVYQAGRFNIRNKFQPVFAEVLIQGNFSLLQCRGNRKMNFYIQHESGSITGLLNQRNIDYVNSEEEIPTLPSFLEVYKDTLLSLFKQDPEMLEQLKWLNYNRSGLLKITNRYLQKSSQNIQYKKNMAPYGLSFGLYAAARMTRIVSMETNEGAVDLSSSALLTFPVAVFCNVSLKYFLSGLSLQTEVSFSKLQSDPGDVLVNNSDVSIESAVIGIPISLRYRFLQNKLSPVLSVGKEIGLVLESSVDRNPVDDSDPYINGYLHRIQAGGWFIGTGVDYKLNNKVYLFTDLRVQAWKNLIIDNSTTDKWSFHDYKNHDYMLLKSQAASLVFGIRF